MSNITVNRLFICPVCGASEFTEIQPYRGESPGFVDKNIIECNTCHLVHMHPLPSDEELGRYYETYWDGEYLKDMLQLFEKQAETRFEFFRPYLPPADSFSVIDVGAGFGLIKKVLTDALKDRAVIYDAVEIDPVAVNYLRDVIKPRVVYPDVKESGEQYHLMILSHIMEHLRNPLQFLRGQQARITNNGLLFIEVPNRDYLFKARNEPHLIFFDPDSLTSLVKRAGYRVLKVDTCGQLIGDMENRQTHAGWVRGFIRSLLPGGIQKLIKKIIDKRAAETVVESVFQYGPERRWIRLAALKES